MTLTEYRQISKGQYGLPRSATADAFFTDALLTDFVNASHKWLAREAWLYFDSDRSESLVSGTGRYPVDTDVIRIDPTNIRINYSSAYTALRHRIQGSLVRQYGALEGTADAAPTSFWLHQGELTNDEAIAIHLFPKPAASGTLYYGAWVYPADLSGDSDRPKFLASEHEKLVPIVCWHMAQADLSRGRANAGLVEMWHTRAKESAAEMQVIQSRAGLPMPGRARERARARR